MARIRSIKPEFWSDRRLARLSRDARLLYISMWNLSDEHGRLHGDARFIKGHCFPYEDDLELEDVEVLLDELAAHGRVQRYESDGDPYLFLPNLSKHQRLEGDKQASRLPAPPEPSPDGPAPRSVENAEKSAESPDLSEEIVAQQVAGSREHVAGVESAHADPPRSDVEGMCRYFLTAITKNGVKASITERWRVEARLLLDRDERPPGEVRDVIDWATQDPFWRSNVLSVPKLRAKYDQLRLGMERTRPATSSGNPHTAWAREQG